VTQLTAWMDVSAGVLPRAVLAACVVAITTRPDDGTLRMEVDRVNCTMPWMEGRTAATAEPAERYDVSESVLDTGEMIEVSVLDEAGAPIFSFLGQVALDLFDVAMMPGRTVMLSQSYPLTVLDAAVGLPGHLVVGHAHFDEGKPSGHALVTAASTLGDRTFVEFDRNVLPSPQPTCRCMGRRMRVNYNSATHFEIELLGDSHG